jgi:hypothetical protein
MGDEIQRRMIAGEMTVEIVFENGATATATSSWPPLLPVTASAAPFTATTATDQVVWRFSGGFGLLNGKTSNLRVFYDGLFGSTMRSSTVGAKASANF